MCPLGGILGKIKTLFGSVLDCPLGIPGKPVYSGSSLGEYYNCSQRSRRMSNHPVLQVTRSPSNVVRKKTVTSPRAPPTYRRLTASSSNLHLNAPFCAGATEPQLPPRAGPAHPRAVTRPSPTMPLPATLTLTRIQQMKSLALK